MSDDLVKRLRHGIGDAVRDHALMQEAADRIEALEVERDAASAALKRLGASCNYLSGRAEKAEAALEKAKEENRWAYIQGALDEKDDSAENPPAARTAYARGIEDAAKVVAEKSDAARKKLGQCVSEGRPEDWHVWSAIVSHLDLARDAIRARAALNREPDT